MTITQPALASLRNSDRQSSSIQGISERLGGQAGACSAYGKRDGMKTIRECIYRYELDLETLVWTRDADMPLLHLDEPAVRISSIGAALRAAVRISVVPSTCRPRPAIPEFRSCGASTPCAPP